ncbi:MAG: thioredoxin family protein [Lentisphaeria bacterium]|nr:thioredoxin family protein [Lentisphaeria bacterium]
MKFFFALCCFLTTALLAPALSAGEWFTDFEKAKAESLKTKRPIYILFTNSDAAADRSLERTIFSQRRFQEYAEKKLVLMKVDFPVAVHLQPKSLSQQNSELRTKYGITILPTALLLDANGGIYIDFIKADGSAEKHRRKINEIMDFDPPKRYSEYLDGFVKKYTPPKPEAKKAEAKPEEKKAEAKKPAKKPAQKPDKKPAEKAQGTGSADTNIPDENGILRIPINPEGDFQEWLKSYQAEEAKEEAREAEEAKEIVEEAKEAIEEAEAAEKDAKPQASPEK